MSRVACLALLLSAVPPWAQAGAHNPAPQVPHRSFELTAKTEHRGVFGLEATAYTLTETVGSTKRELWRILDGGTCAHHWISPNGTVWVLTAGLSGRAWSSRLWARDVTADVLGNWPGRWQDAPPEGGQPASDALVLSECRALSLLNGSEQLRLPARDGSEFRATVAKTSSGLVQLFRHFAKGEARVDRMTDLMDTPYDTTYVDWPAGHEVPIAVWTFPNEPRDKFLIQTYEPAYELAKAPKRVTSERVSPRRPAYVAKTLSGKVLWFEFGELWEPPLAKLDILSFAGKLILSADLLKLGGFRSSEEARMSIQFRDIVANAGGRYELLDSRNAYGAQNREELRFGDRSGRKYKVVIHPNGESFVATAVASLNLDPKPTWEFSYPGATLESQTESTSPDGGFHVRLRTYVRAEKAQSQLTLFAHVTDPIEGRKTVEMYSVPFGTRPHSIKVSDSGRVYALLFANPSDASLGDRETVVLRVFKFSGSSDDIDLVRIRWFANVADAKGKIDLKNLSIELEGLRAERLVDKVPVPTYLLEILTFDLGGGRTAKLSIQYMDEVRDTVFRFSRPGIGGD